MIAKLGLAILGGLVTALLISLVTWSVAYLTGGWIDPLNKFSGPNGSPVLNLVASPNPIPEGQSSVVTLIVGGETDGPCEPYTIVWSTNVGELEILDEGVWRPMPPGPSNHELVRWTAPRMTRKGHVEARMLDCAQEMWIASVLIPVVAQSPPQ